MSPITIVSLDEKNQNKNKYIVTNLFYTYIYFINILQTWLELPAHAINNRMDPRTLFYF